MSCRSTTSRPCAIWHWVDGLPDTVAALLHSDNESPFTVARSLCVTSRPALYYCRLAVSMSCSHLMLPVHHVWLSCMHLMRRLLCVPGEVMMSPMLGILGTHGHALEVGGPSRVSRQVEWCTPLCWWRSSPTSMRCSWGCDRQCICFSASTCCAQ
jgi:hypothetical protein